MQTKKIRGIIISFVIFFINVYQRVYAFGINDLTGTDPGTSGLSKTFGKILGVFTIIGSIVSVLALVALGIKYMLGSVEERAEYKKSMMPYVIGAVLVFAASTIAQAIYQFVIKL